MATAQIVDRVLYRNAGQGPVPGDARSSVLWTHCYKCRGEVGVPLQLAGRQFKCPGCEAEIQAPSAPHVHCARGGTQNVASDDNTQHAVDSLKYGLIGLIAWILPIFGLPSAMLGFKHGILGCGSSRTGTAIVGIFLSLIVLGLSLTNVWAGRYYYKHGQFPPFMQAIAAKVMNNSDPKVIEGSAPVVLEGPAPVVLPARRK